MNKRLLSFSLLTSACILSAVSARAADRYYVGPDGGLWNNTANWSDTSGGSGGFSAPGTNDNVFIQPSSSISVTLDTDITGDGVHIMRIGATGGATAQFFHNANTLKINERLSIGDVAGSQATYSLNGGTLDLTGDDFAGPLLVGQAGTGILNIAGLSAVTTTGNVEVGITGDGTVNHSSGTLTVGSGRSLFIGRSVGSSGTYNMSGTAYLSLYGGNLQLGYEGDGIFVQDGGTVLLDSPNANAGHVFIAGATTATGSYTINGGTLTALSVRVGGDVATPGGPATFTVSGGTVQAGLQVWNNGTVTLNSGTIDVGSDPLADNIRNDGLIIINGGSFLVGGRIYGTGEVIQASGATSFDDETAIDTGGVTIAGGTAKAMGKLLVGRNTGSTGIVNVTGGTLSVTNGTFGVGNGGALTNGAGVGHVTVSNATLDAASIILGSTIGGEGDLTVQSNGHVIVRCGFTLNKLIMNGGSLEVVHDPAANCAFEDVNLHDRIVAGYLRDGEGILSNGTIKGIEMVIGLSNGRGTFTQAGGSVNLSSNLLVGMTSTATGTVTITGGNFVATNGVVGVGNNGTVTGSGGVGHVTVSNATLDANSIVMGTTSGGTGDLTVQSNGHVIVRCGFTLNKLIMNGGSLEVVHDPAANCAFEDVNLHDRIVAGYLRDGEAVISNGTINGIEMVIGLQNGNGTLTQAGGTINLTSNMLIGVNSTATGTVTMTGGSLVCTTAVFGVGNNGTITGGNGTGHAIISGGTLTVAHVVLGSTVGGYGDMTISGTGHVIDKGAFTLNKLIMNGGTLEIIAGPLPPFEDPVFKDSLVGGYLRDGEAVINAGYVSTPNVKLGVSSGNTGSLTMSGGSMSVLSNMVVGDCGVSATGIVTMTGGSLYVTNAAGNAVLDVRGGTFTFSAGTVTVNQFVMTNACGTFVHTGGTLIYGTAVLDPNRDDDGDGISNGYEQSHGLDPLNSADAALDSDGDGLTNLQEFQAGTDATNSVSFFGITAIARQANTNILVTWQMGPSKTNALERTAGVGGSFATNNFAAIFTVTNTVGTTTNYLDSGAATNLPSRYYRIRLVP